MLNDHKALLYPQPNRHFKGEHRCLSHKFLSYSEFCELQFAGAVSEPVMHQFDG